MYICLQFPFADSRNFIENSGLLHRPTWPAPDPNCEFVRSFGAIRRRKRGGVKGWIGENEICEANSSFRFENFPTTKYSCDFRRLYFDGYAVGKLEVGLTKRRKVNWNDNNIDEIIDDIINLDVSVEVTSQESAKCKILGVGKFISKLYKNSSTSHSTSNNLDDWVVDPGCPLFLLEANEGDGILRSEKLPLQTLNLYNDHQVRISHAFFQKDGVSIPILILERYSPPLERTWFGSFSRFPRITWEKYKEDKKVTFNKIRTLRLYLLRLHAEHQCLRIILRNISTGKLIINKGRPETEWLQGYLNQSTKRIFKWENSTNSLFDVDIASLARQYEDQINPGQREALLNLLEREQIRLNVLNKVKGYTTININNGGLLNMAEKIEYGDQINISGGQQGVVGRNAQVQNVIQSGAQQVNDIDTDQLAQELGLLLPELRKRATETSHDESIVAVGQALTAAKEGDRPKILQSLSKAGEWVFKVATDIGVKVAAEVINRTLYPK